MGSGGRAQPHATSSHRARGALRGPRAQTITLQSLGCFTTDPTSRDAALRRPGRAQPREHRQGLAAVSHGNEAWQVESCPELGFTVQGAQPDTPSCQSSRCRAGGGGTTRVNLPSALKRCSGERHRGEAVLSILRPSAASPHKLSRKLPLKRGVCGLSIADHAGRALQVNLVLPSALLEPGVHGRARRVPGAVLSTRNPGRSSPAAQLRSILRFS